MQIISYKKKKNNLYEVALSNKEKLNLYDDVILKYGLLLKKEIDSKLLKEIKEFNYYLEAYNLILKYLKTKLRTEKEIRKKLENYNQDITNYVIERLKKDGLLNSELYIKAYINDAVNLKLEGPNKIVRELKRLGFMDDEVNNFLNTFSSDIWYPKIRKIIQKKISSNRNLSSIILKQKIIGDLIHQGFREEDIQVVVNEFNFEVDEDIYLKAYNKIKNRLQRKYSGEELEYKISLEMYKKGFRK